MLKVQFFLMSDSTKINYYLNLEEPLKGSLLTVREIILDCDKELSETIKYGVPCFLFKDRPICYLFKKKTAKLPYILFVKGKELDFPELDMGDRKLMKSLSFDPEKDLDIKLIQKIILTAIFLH